VLVIVYDLLLDRHWVYYTVLDITLFIWVRYGPPSCADPDLHNGHSISRAVLYQIVRLNLILYSNCPSIFKI